MIMYYLLCHDIVYALRMHKSETSSIDDHIVPRNGIDALRVGASKPKGKPGNQNVAVIGTDM